MKRAIAASLLGGFLSMNPARAHVPSTAQIVLSIQGRHLSGHWDVALRDLDYGLGLDTNEDGKISWAEVTSHAPDLAAYCRSHLVLHAGETPLAVECGPMQVERRGDGVYLILSLSAELPEPAPTVRLDYDAFFALDSLHRGVLRPVESGDSRTVVLSPAKRSHTFRPPAP